MTGPSPTGSYPVAFSMSDASAVASSGTGARTTSVRAVIHASTQTARRNVAGVVTTTFTVSRAARTAAALQPQLSSSPPSDPLGGSVPQSRISVSPCSRTVHLLGRETRTAGWGFPGPEAPPRACSSARDVFIQVRIDPSFLRISRRTLDRCDVSAGRAAPLPTALEEHPKRADLPSSQRVRSQIVRITL